MATFEITGPDGKKYQITAPDNATDADVLAYAKQNIGGAQPAPAPQTSPSALKGGVLGGAFMGLRDGVDAGAQMLVRGADAAVRGINSATGLDIPRPDVAGVDNIVKAANLEYEQSRKLAGREGVDVARIGGAIANPVNRLVGPGAASLAGVVARAGAQGGISGAMSPVLDTENFWSEKGKQAGIGAAAGAAAGYGLDKLARGVGNVFAQARARPGFPAALGGATQGTPPQALAQQAIMRAAAEQGVDIGRIPRDILDDVTGQVTSALKSGKTLDANALIRMAEGRAVLGDDAGLMLGQATRDPQQFARELDLRGIAGAGKPIADRLNTQNQRIIEKVGGLGAKGAPDAYEAGSTAMAALRQFDDQMSKEVTAAYTKFRNASGATLDVPLQPVAQRVGEVLDTYGRENLPAAVLSKLDSYGVLGNKQTKVFDLMEADKLIKVINANFDPMKAPQAGALGQLRKGLQEAIDLADVQTQGQSGPAAELLREAIGKAKSRFSLHEAIPALEAASRDRGAQEAFVRQYITSGSAGIDTVSKLVKVMPPEALDTVRRNVLADILERAAPGAGRGSDAATFSQASYNRALDAIGDRKLLAIFGEDGVNQLRQVGRVSEWIQKQPKGSAVNNSNTGAAVMNLLQGLSNSRVMTWPGLNLARNSLRQAADESATSNALAAKLSPAGAKLSPEEVNALRAFLPSAGGAFGTAAVIGSR